MQAAQNATLLSLGHLSGSVQAGGNASVTSYGFLNPSSISGNQGVTVLALDQLTTQVTSSAGSVTVTAAGPMTLTSLTPDATISGMSTMEIVASNVGGNLDVALGDQLRGELMASGNVTVATLKDETAQVDAGQDAILTSAGHINGAVNAGHDIEATAYQGIQLGDKSFTAGNCGSEAAGT